MKDRIYNKDWYNPINGEKKGKPSNKFGVEWKNMNQKTLIIIRHSLLSDSGWTCVYIHKLKLKLRLKKCGIN